MQRPVLVVAFATTFLVACPAPQQDCLPFCDLQPAAMASSDFSLPLDATLSPDGKIAYFLGVTPNGPGVLTTEIGGSTVSTMVSGAPLASPMGLDVTTNGSKLYIADAAADPADEGKLGRLFTLDAAGGIMLTEVGSTAGYKPRAVTVITQGVDQVYFSGNDPTDGMPGVFKIADGAVTVSDVAKGEPFIDPSGIAVARNGDVYVADTSDSATTAQVLKISGGTVTPLVTELRVGYPAGLALTYDEKTLIISALDKDSGKDVVFKYTLADGTMDPFTTGIGEFEQSAGLHRAKRADAYVWADSNANGGGTVYVINPGAQVQGGGCSAGPGAPVVWGSLMVAAGMFLRRLQRRARVTGA